jgi:hypothetical protein
MIASVSQSIIPDAAVDARRAVSVVVSPVETGSFQEESLQRGAEVPHHPNTPETWQLWNCC